MRFDRCNRTFIQVPAVSGHECATPEAQGGFASRCPQRRISHSWQRFDLKLRQLAQRTNQSVEYRRENLLTRSLKPLPQRPFKHSLVLIDFFQLDLPRAICQIWSAAHIFDAV